MLVDFYLYKKKRLYCAFIDYRKAFVNRVALWRNYYVIILMAKFSKLFLTFTIMQSLVLKQAGTFQCFSVVRLVFAKVKISPQSCSRCS